MIRTRINLHVMHLDENGATVYTPLHIGFFPRLIVPSIVKELNAIGIAFHSDVPRQKGRVHVAVADMTCDNPEESEVKSLDYEPPRARHNPDMKGIIRRLLACAELSQDDLEDGTLALIDEAAKAIEG